MGRTWVLLAAMTVLGADEPKVSVWVGVGRPERGPAWTVAAPRLLPPPPFQFRLDAPLDAFRGAKGSPGATVVVWGTAPQARQEEMDRFVHDYAPWFRTAFDAGTAASVGRQMLSRTLELAGNPNQNPAPAIAPSVWYNAMDPWARDPRWYR